MYKTYSLATFFSIALCSVTLVAGDNDNKTKLTIAGITSAQTVRPQPQTPPARPTGRQVPSPAHNDSHTFRRTSIMPLFTYHQA